MPDFQVEDIDIDPSEFVYACNKREIKELIDTLIEENHIRQDAVINDETQITRANVPDCIFNDNLNVLSTNRLRLTIEEEDLINKLAERFRYL
jgi:CTP synthase (UTP-ammonia lyase)